MDINRINVGPVRLSYPSLFKPEAINGSDTKKYNVCLLIPKTDTALIENIKKTMAASIPQTAIVNGKLPKNYRLPLRDGDVDKEDRAEYAGMYFINANSTLKPQCVRKVNGAYVEATEEELYPGVWAYVNINFFAYDRNGNRGLGASLNAVIKFKDDESFGGSVVPVDKLFEGVDIPDTQAAAADVLSNAPVGDMPMDIF